MTRLVYVLLLLVPAMCSQKMSWPLVDAMIERDYPGVPSTSTSDLAAQMEHPDGPSPVLLDVRTEAEYAVSHLAGARRVDPDHPDLTWVDDLPRDTPIVAYCSVGYRSAALVEQLRASGFTEAQNLRGSIFVWANEDRPVFRDSVRVGDVHPYDTLWGLLLRRTYRTKTPR